VQDVVYALGGLILLPFFFMAALSHDRLVRRLYEHHREEWKIVGADGILLASPGKNWKRTALWRSSGRRWPGSFVFLSRWRMTPNAVAPYDSSDRSDRLERRGAGPFRFLIVKSRLLSR
jgi:hypothetical protein